MFSMICGLIGIMSAMPEEGELIKKNMHQAEKIEVGGRQFFRGQIEEKEVLFCLSGIGKVSAATTATLMIDKFGVEKILFTGVAGGGNETEVGDIVIGKSYLQHDLDLTPIYPKFYISNLDKQILHADDALIANMEKAASAYLEVRKLQPFNLIKDPKVHVGLVLSGDQFIYSEYQRDRIFSDLKSVDLDKFHAVEMEGAAVAQVCHEFKLPFVVIRAISDKANSESQIDFPLFIQQVASEYSIGILKEFFKDN